MDFGRTELGFNTFPKQDRNLFFIRLVFRSENGR